MWLDDLSEALDVLARADRGHAIVELADTENHYVQILADDAPGSTSALLEAVCNEWLYDGEEITPEQEEALERLGWHRPYTDCDPAEGCEIPHRNWYRFATVTVRAS
jgi:hypothetical protein